MSSDSSAISVIQELLAQYVGQLTQGCGNPACREPFCCTGRQNSSPPNKAVRSWTPRSARAIALGLVAASEPRKHVCQYYKSTTPGSRRQAETEPVRDPASFEQLFCDTEAVRKLFLPSETITIQNSPYQEHFDALQRLTSSVDVADKESANYHGIAAATNIVCQALKACLDDVPKGPIAQYGFADRWVRKGHAFPNQNTPTPADARWNIWLGILDSFESPSANRLLAKLCEAIAVRVKLEHDVVGRRGIGIEGSSDGMASEWLLSIVVPKLERDCDISQQLALIIWLKKLFLLHWAGAMDTPSTTPAHGALLLIEAFHGPSAFKNRKDKPLSPISAVATRVDAVEIAESWMRFKPDYGRSRHLLSFEFLFEARDRALYFRTVNHLRMRQAHNEAEKAGFLRRRVAPKTTDEEPDDPIKYAEEHYLLLNVSRTNILQDAFNQLWQRRADELFRPLRVRLGEVEEFEIGHDLGGVQIEFFNLVCKEIFAENAQMFTSNAKTGLSYFRAGCLQPLYLFELFGLLVALAIYNGVTLPVSFPIAFYRILLGALEEGIVCNQYDAFNHEDLRDGWMDDMTSLKYILETDGAEADLDYIFPLEANGLRLFVYREAGCRQSLSCEGKLRLRVAHAMPVAFPAPNNPDVQELDWPGWQLEHENTDHASASHTVESKFDYVREYVHWLVFGSVEPQWNAFQRGFSRVLDRHTLRIFSCPEQLRSYVEGSTRLDIRELRAAARYEGYEANSSYMKMFWRVVSSWTEEKQKQLLKFVTAAERVPVGGTKDITFVIQENAMADFSGADGREAPLPTSSTCFGMLSLPRYPSATVLDKKLSLAIKYGMEGFGTG